jgi:hypothetical protein
MKLVSRLTGLLLVAATLSACGGNSATNNPTTTSANSIVTSTIMPAASPTAIAPTVVPVSPTTVAPTAIPAPPTPIPASPTTIAAATSTPAIGAESSTTETVSAMQTRETGERSAAGGAFTKNDILREDGYLDSAVTALKKNDFATAKKWYGEYESCWKLFGDKVKDLSANLYKEIEGEMATVSGALNAASPDANKTIAALTSLKQSTDKETALITSP